MRRLASLLFPAALLLAACAGAPPAGTPPAPPGEPSAPSPAAAPPLGTARFEALAARFTDRAVKQERSGELRRALDSWKLVAALRPEAAEPKRRVAELAARLSAEAQRRYRSGSDRIREGNVDAARRELLLALAADPDHAEALAALRSLEPEAAPHTVAAGETFESIAKQAYGDPAKGAIVARINDLDPAARPKPGTVLTLPSLELPKKATGRPAPESPGEMAEPPDVPSGTNPTAIGDEPPPAASPPPREPVGEKPPPDPAEGQLAKARELFKARKFEEAGAAADALADNPAVGQLARELSGNAWFAAGDDALKQERFTDAATAYRKAEPARKDAAAALAAVERRKKEKAEELYTAGVRFFINQELDEAIRSWEQTLALNPEHPKAPRDIEKARALQRKLREIR